MPKSLTKSDTLNSTPTDLLLWVPASSFLPDYLNWDSVLREAPAFLSLSAQLCNDYKRNIQQQLPMPVSNHL